MSVGRYEGPDFDAPEENVVSVWMATCPMADIPENYFQADLDGEDEDPFTEFSSDFGFGCFDYDFVESYCRTDWQEENIDKLIQPLSYSSSFLDSVLKAANKLKIEKTSFVFLIYNFKYDPSITNTNSSRYMQFLGVFDYDPESRPNSPEDFIAAQSVE